MEQEPGTDQPLVTGVVASGESAEASGVDIGDFAGPVEYQGYAREGMRHAWTREPDQLGRYHALTLQRQDDESWQVTADQPFERLDDAQEWALRLFAETAN